MRGFSLVIGISGAALLGACGSAAAPPVAPGSAGPQAGPEAGRKGARRVPEFTPLSVAPPASKPAEEAPAVAAPSEAARAAACAEARKQELPAVEAALKARALKLAVDVAMGQRLRDLRHELAASPDLTLRALGLAEVGGQICAKGAGAAAAISEAALRLALVASVCSEAPVEAQTELAAALAASGAAGCPLGAQAEATGVAARLAGAATLDHAAEARGKLLEVLRPKP